MTWTRPTLLGLAVLFMLFVFIQFFLGGLMMFEGVAEWSTDHERVGYPVLHTIPLVMLVIAAVGRMGGKLIGMCGALVVMVGIQPQLIGATDTGWVNALHIPFGLLIAFLGYHILVAASRAYKGGEKAF